MCGECPGAARLCGQCTQTARQSVLHRRRWMSSVWNIPAVATGTWRKLQHSRRHEGPLRLCTRIGWKIQARRSGSRQNLDDIRKQRPGRLIFCTTASVPGCGAALDVCVASSTAAAARGDAAQAAFDWKTSHDRRETKTRESKVSSIVRWSGQPMRLHTQLSRERFAMCSGHSGLSKRAADAGKSSPT